MRVILSVALAMGATAAIADDKLPADLTGTYLCKDTASAGIYFDQTSKQWKPAVFNVADDATLLKVRFTGKTGKFDFLDMAYRVYEVRVKKFGKEGEGDYCTEAEADYPTVRASGNAIRCSQVSYDYWFNLETKKYQIAYDGGYMSPEHNTNTPAVTVGICDKID